MRLVTLVTNTDDSAFAQARPLDDAKFEALIAEVRPDWQVTAFWVCKNVFPEEIGQFDGILITGSPASVHTNAAWMRRLEDLILQIVDRGLPVFGACFGHQIIAKALGAPVVRNPDGWGHGLLEIHRAALAPWSGSADPIRLFGSHIEQVGALPDGARTLFSGRGCPIAGFAIKDHVFTVQHHPEMTREFMSDLVEHYADDVGPEVTQRARQSLAQGDADRRAFAEEITVFFEQSWRR